MVSRLMDKIPAASEEKWGGHFENRMDWAARLLLAVHKAENILNEEGVGSGSFYNALCEVETGVMMCVTQAKSEEVREIFGTQQSLVFKRLFEVKGQSQRWDLCYCERTGFLRLIEVAVKSFKQNAGDGEGRRQLLTAESHFIFEQCRAAVARLSEK
jgi:hypothetical protein